MARRSNWLTKHLAEHHPDALGALLPEMHTGNYSTWLLYHERLARAECNMIEPKDPDNLRPVYGGPTLLETLWEEMDRLMEGLMTKTDHHDGGDKFRAEELGYIIAIITNVYEPNIQWVRQEALRRFRKEA